MIGLAVLGSTGSIGRQTLDVVRSLPDRFDVVALAARTNVTLLEEQAREFRPKLLYAGRESEYLMQRMHEGAIHGQWAEMEEMAAHPAVDVVVVSTVGAAGLGPTLAAIRAGKAVAIANKEVLVMAGHIITSEAKFCGAEIRPIDSEHSAVWQCLWGEEPESVDRIVLTASGGPFRDKSPSEMARVTAEEALRHPNWQMGQKITWTAPRSSTGLECIEARWLFDIRWTASTLLHRESIVHSLVEFRDGSLKAQLGVPDMRLPIQCALTYPERPARPAEAGPEEDWIVDSACDQTVPCLALALARTPRRDVSGRAGCGGRDRRAELPGHIGFLTSRTPSTTPSTRTTAWLSRCWTRSSKPTPGPAPSPRTG
jgi:1-deoxy-D-xylulose-5-phosphate reductoisomerase